MHQDMVLLAERLVIAMETMSQDVKNMSAYVYDLSCSVSYLVHERREKECISVVECDEGGNSSNVTSAPGQEASDEPEYSGQCEQADERLSTHVTDPELGESSSGDLASMSIDPREDSDVQASVSNPIFTRGIKIEEQADSDVNDVSCVIHNVFGPSRNKVKTVEHGSTLGQEIQHLEASSNNPVNCEFVTHMIETTRGQPRAWGMDSASDVSMVHTGVESEEKPYKCSVCNKSFKTCSKLKRHFRVHTGEKPYQCKVCGKMCSQRGNLAIHMRSHTGEKPYNCTLCGKEFAYSSCLTRHMFTHSAQYLLE